MNTHKTMIGNSRFEADKRKIAGVLMAISITVCFFPLARIAPFVNGNGETVDHGIEFSALVGNLIAMAMGLMGISLAWAELVHEYSNPGVTFAVSIFEILAFIPYVTDIVMIGKAADSFTPTMVEGNETIPGVYPFIPPLYKPTEDDAWFVGAMGMIGAGTFCLFLFGSYALLVMALYAYQSGNPETRNAGYYRVRLVFYSCVMAIAGLAQLSLGAYVVDKFGSGPLPAPIMVAMFFIWFPEINIAVGSLFVFNGLYGMFRGLFGAKDPYFAFTMWLQLVSTLVLMICVQTWWAPGNAMAPAVPTLANLTLGIPLIMTFLDYLARTQPEEVTEDYYYGEETVGLKKHVTELPDVVGFEHVLPNYVLKEHVQV